MLDTAGSASPGTMADTTAATAAAGTGTRACGAARASNRDAVMLPLLLVLLSPAAAVGEAG
jgi:hypothetical protein